MPFKGYRITSPYGLRTDPITKQKNVFHDGIDLVKSHKAPIEAFVGGKVLYAGDGVTGTGVGGYGNVVVIEDKNKRAHVYAHLDSVSVKKGQTVKQGDVIGRQGETGKRVTGSHLHYEIRKKSSPSLGWVNDPKARTLDPTEYLKDYYASAKKSVSQMADEVLASGKTGNTARAKYLGLSLAEYEPVRQEINKQYGKGKSTQSINKSVLQMADMIISNPKAPTGHENRRKWLEIDKATYEKVRVEVNKRLK